MSWFKVDLNGLSKLEQDIIRSDRALKKSTKTADRIAARKVARRMRRRAPKGDTGHLSGSIRASKAEISIGAIYAGVINFGWPERNIAAQEFIYSSIKTSEREFMKDYLDEADRALRFIALG